MKPSQAVATKPQLSLKTAQNLLVIKLPELRLQPAAGNRKLPDQDI